MPLTTVSTAQIVDWTSDIPGRLEQFIGCDFFHESEGWLILVKVSKNHLTMKDQQGHTDKFARSVFDAYFIEAKVPSDSEVVTSYKDISALGDISRNYDLPYEGLIQAHADDKEMLGNLLRILKAKERPTRDGLRWLQGRLGDKIALKYPTHTGLENVSEEKSKTYLQGQVNHVGSFEVAYYDDYYPMRFGREHEPSQRLLRFKRGDSGAIDFYAEKVLPYFRKGVTLCCAPSSSKNRWGSGLVALLDKLSGSVPCAVYTDLICRTKSIEKQSISNIRNLDINLDTMTVVKAERCRDRDIVVVDDVVSSGTTLRACTELLWQAQAASVSCVTMCKTINEYELKRVLDDEINF
jgi:hypothetical protein